MPWHRFRVGCAASKPAGVVHALYEHVKGERVYWTTQCSLAWAGRNNTRSDRRPPLVDAPINCIECLALEVRLGRAV